MLNFIFWISDHHNYLYYWIFRLVFDNAFLQQVNIYSVRIIFMLYHCFSSFTSKLWRWWLYLHTFHVSAQSYRTKLRYFVFVHCMLKISPVKNVKNITNWLHSNCDWNSPNFWKLYNTSILTTFSTQLFLVKILG